MSEGKLNKVKQIYVIVLLISLLLRSINVYSLIPSIYDGALFAFLATMGAIFLLNDFFTSLKARKFTYDKFLVFFIIVLVISIVVNRQFGVVSNLKLMVWNSIYFFLVYESGKTFYKEDSFFIKINFSLIIAWFVVSFLSLIMFLLKFGYEKYTSPQERIRIGFLESRLFGLFGDPNYGAIVCIVVSILSIFYLINGWNKKGVLLKLFLIINIAIQFSVLLLSGSRSALLISFVIVGISTFIYSFIFSSKRSSRNFVVRMIISLIVTLAVTGFYFLLQKETKDILQTIPEHVKYELKFENTKNKVELGTEKDNKKNNEVSLVRKDVAQNKDISNMRFSIWKSAIEIFKTTPWVGTSPRNLIPYAQKYLPNTFIAQRLFVAHNTFINVLVSTGIFGFLLFVFFLIWNAISIIIFYFKNRNKLSSSYYIYLAAVTTLVLSGFFVNELILVNTVGALVFWLYLGKLNGHKEGKILDEKSKNES
ncbi:O-antigen ligase family protein [Enterococcus devriesei]|uniref:O-antigen ligase family protein n=1 Tax=Enterococcus devriesei TaxID=319970 RepID=UPI0009FDFC78|nr:O-antigen ligase family protein [Enterococcus devriesei]